ncbi:LysE/ArgO family amino acid transporter [Modestobacter versicolor]|uniref:Amino acid transporter n=1 Tax=Modestobacter versicolor TaxID=429133 RepID=A0A323VCY9_9ACTN|nr:LysE/ArgO family amino acid transporter [Modestobacter versicolor]MBB3678666.1 L-lysine exporter family protein LysE/ArgO [Modestobacter versicolor]PZA22040.1 amino acid transporter [Modestobacter versicolor]
MDPALLAAAAGLGLGLSLIVAIGAQNAFVLRQGLRMEHVVAVVLVCALSDAVLIVAGVGGAGAVVTRAPEVVQVVCFAGAAFLLVYGLMAARRVFRPAALLPESGGARAGLAVTITTCLALTWLNPHVYLDTVVLLGSLASTYDDQRWWFAAGATLGSVLWFTGLGFGARLLRPVFARPTAWRVLDAVIAVVMVSLAASLAVRGLHGG